MKFRIYLLSAILVAAAGSVLGQSGAAFSFRATASVGSAPADSSGRALTPAAMQMIERGAFQNVNKERSLAGLPMLKWNDKIAAVARMHSFNMAELNFFSHRGLDGSMVDDRAAKMAMGAWSAIGENIAFIKGFDNPADTVVEKWLGSAGHKKNLLGPEWTETAIGLAVTPDGKYYFTQVFIRN